MATVAWDPGMVSNPACPREWTSCAAAYPGSPLSGSFAVDNQASSIVVYGWKANGSQPTVSLDGTSANELDTHWQPSQDEINVFRSVLSTFRHSPGTLDTAWVQFSVAFPSLGNGGEPTKLVLADGSATGLSDDATAPRFHDPTVIFQNITIFCALGGSGPADGGANPTYDAGKPAMDRHRSSATVIVLAVVVPVVTIAVVALAVSWVLRYRRILGPSVVPQVPTDETRRPSRPVAEK